jgi:hypothetical protein
MQNVPQNSFSRSTLETAVMNMVNGFINILLLWTNDQILRHISLPYFPKISKKLSKLVTNSNNYKIKNKLGSVKDEINYNNKSGIYQISCGIRGCNLKS